MIKQNVVDKMSENKIPNVEQLGINAKKLSWNLNQDELIEKAKSRKEGILTKTGAFLVTTGKTTGRSPNDRFIVDTADIHDKINWGKVNVPISEENYKKLYEHITKFVSGLDEVFVFDGIAGADPKYQLKVRFVNEFAFQNLFVRQLFREQTKEEREKEENGFTVICAPSYKADPKIHGTNSDVFVLVNLKKKVVIIGGTKYSGEIKKSIFSVMNYMMPEVGVLPMHCGANKGTDDVAALFFGLSGTGKTSLSVDSDRKLIGDDEHGWTEDGVFNFENGCYAKCINLSLEKEPQIYNAIKTGAVVENVVLKENGDFDFDDGSITENTRAGYPLTSVDNVDLNGVGKHPKTIIFLTADAFGVMPPISKLTSEGARYHFLTGYTSKLAGTEVGVTEPKAAFSSFFGDPFMPLKPKVYIDLLKEKLDKHKSQVFLVNTGWIKGAYGKGERIHIKYSRAMVNAAINGELDNVEYVKDENFNLMVPKSCPGVPDEILDAKGMWDDAEAYEAQAKKLAGLFLKNNERFKDIPKEVLAAGPKL